MNASRIVFTGIRKVELQDQERPAAGLDEVVVRTERTLISPGTELAMYEGTHSALQDPEVPFAKYPHGPGYAAIGRVEDCGASVDNLKAGDRIFFTGPHATWSLLKPASGLWLPLPDEIQPNNALFARLVQIAATASHCLRRRPERVIVLGAGLIGLFAAQVLQAEGVPEVVLQDINAARLAIAKRCGVRRCVLGAGLSLEASLGQMSSRPNAVIEATGVPNLVPAALAAVMPGGDVVLLGSPRGFVELDIYKYIHRKGVALIGAHEIALPDRAPAPQPSRQALLEQAMRWLGDGKICVDGLVTDVVRPVEMAVTYERMSVDKSNVLGVVVDWS